MDEQPTPSPSPNLPPREPVGPDYWRPKRHRWLWYLLGLVIILTAAGLFWLWRHPKQPASTNNQTSTQTNQNTAAKTSPPQTATQNYNSSDFNLSFDYPKDWTVTDSGNGQLTVRSTTTALTAADGQSVNGQIVMTIAKKGQNLNAFDSGNAVAALSSQKVAYTHPTQNQRADTYLSFLQYANTTTAGALDGIYITGDFGYQKGQYVPKTDVAKIDPLVMVTFVKCASSACPVSTTTGLSIKASSWNDTSFASTLEMLKSLSIN